MNGIKCFWSYVRADDEAEDGRITELGRDVAKQFGLLTAQELDLFLDLDSLNWGDMWLQRIEEAIAATAFFIPILTPRYFLSPSCRNELNLFMRSAKNLGVSELILPILYVDTPTLNNNPHNEEILNLLKNVQREDWRILRFSERDSTKYRKAVAGLAERLVEVFNTVEITDIPETLTPLAKNKEGELELMAKTEELLPQWAVTIKSMGQEVESISSMMDSATAEMKQSNQRGESLRSKLKILKKFAIDLLEPASKLESLGKRFTNQLYDLDGGMRVYIRKAKGMLEKKHDPEEQRQAKEVLSNTESMLESYESLITSLQEMFEAMTSLEDISSEVRKPISIIKAGLSALLEGKKILNEWGALLVAVK